MKKNKYLLIGILIGVIISTSMAAFGTDLISNAYFNPDLKLAINGNEVQDIRIITVEIEGEPYGRNYYSIADLIKAFNDYGGISAKVDFDAKTQTTVVEVEREVVMITPTPEPTPIPPTYDELMEYLDSIRQDEEPEPEKNNEADEPVVNRYTEDGLEILEADGEKYIDRKEVERVLREHYEGSAMHVFFNESNGYLGIACIRIVDIGFSDITKFPERKPVPEELTELQIPWSDPVDEGEYYIKHTYYVDSILPHLK